MILTLSMTPAGLSSSSKSLKISHFIFSFSSSIGSSFLTAFFWTYPLASNAAKEFLNGSAWRGIEADYLKVGSLKPAVSSSGLVYSGFAITIGLGIGFSFIISLGY